MKKSTRDVQRLALFILPFLLAIGILVFGGQSIAAPRIMLFGDSLSSGYGLADDQGLSPMLKTVLSQQGVEVEIIGSSIAGDTTGDGLQRLNWVIADKPDLFILALGANDMLRSIPVETIKGHLVDMMTILQQNDIPVLLVGMQAPPNYGAAYVNDFSNVYQNLATDYQLPLYPFLLDGVVAVASLNQADGIHPNGKGVLVIAERLAPYVIDALKRYNLLEETPAN